MEGAEAMDEITPQDFAFVQPLRVRWSEVDQQGIVFNPHYLAYADLAITEYMRAIGFPYPESLHAHGTDTFAVHAEVTFKASLAMTTNWIWPLASAGSGAPA